MRLSVGGIMKYRIVKINENNKMIEEAAKWFSDKWNISQNAYLESMCDSLNNVIPRWYVVLDEGKIIAGLGVIENDFHPRTDLTPNVCAIYVEEAYRKQSIAGEMLKYVEEDMKNNGIDTLYLITNHNSFYERYGWEYMDDVICDGEDYKSRVYKKGQ